MTQEIAIQKINDGKNIFISGSAGVGKSWVVNKVTTANTLVCAPTGIAALNVGGTTCHKLFGLPLGLPTAKDYEIMPRKLIDLFGYESSVDKIIIDEAGMVRADMLDMINHRLQKVKCNRKPFGGVQIILSGDFYQLEPIVSWQDSERYYDEYPTPYCFSSESFNFEPIELTEVRRQTDERQVRMLNEIRVGGKLATRALNSIMNEAKEYVNSKETLHLCCYKENAARINHGWYSKETGESKTFQAKYVGSDKGWDAVPVEAIVSVKVGCKVLICANDINGQYVNGDRGTVTGFKPKSVTVDIKGRVVEVEQFTWERYNYSGRGSSLSKEVEAKMTQMPLTLGYAVTVHKSQGMTLDELSLEVGKGCFSAGQLYVALSRIRDLRNISIVTKIHSDNIIVSEHVRDFYNNR